MTHFQTRLDDFLLPDSDTILEFFMKEDELEQDYEASHTSQDTEDLQSWEATVAETHCAYH